MHAIQVRIFQPGLNITDENELVKKKEVQNFVLSKIYSFLKSEDRKEGGSVCKDWEQILHVQVNCARLLDFIQEYCDRHASVPEEYAGIIGELEGQLAIGGASSGKIFKDKWYSFAKQCAVEVHSVVWIAKTFQEHRFSKLYGCIDLLEQIAGKNMLVHAKRLLSVSMRDQLQKELIEELVEVGQIQAAVDTFAQMTPPDKELGEGLIRCCKACQEYKAALDVAEKMGIFQSTLMDIITELAGCEQYEIALDLIKENDEKANAASLMLILCCNIANNAHGHKVSDEMVGLIVERMRDVSFDCIKRWDDSTDPRENLMRLLVDELLKRKMVDQAVLVYYKLAFYTYLSKVREETSKKIAQYRNGDT